jgi:hypothetical protein
VADPTISAIDRFFDAIDSGVEKLDHVFNRGKQTEEKHRARRVKREIIEAEATPKAGPKTTPKKTDAAASTSMALARKPHFRIVESITPSGTIYVVTDGGNARTECSTREFAEKVLRALEAAP